MRKLGGYFSLSLLVLVLDQWSKAAIVAALLPDEVRPLTSFFNLVLAHNRGSAFSFLDDAGGWQRFFFIAIAIGASAVIVHLLDKHREQKLFCVALSLIMGGAIGNLWDRVSIGSVVDFLNFHAGAHHFPAFNLADSAITLGAFLLILDSFKKQPK